MKNHKINTQLFQELNDIVNKLRKPGGCDWDRAQTANSLIPYFIEEVYELIDGIDKKDSNNIKEGKLETFMGWMQSDEGMGVRKSVAYPEKTVGAMIPDKSGMLFKVSVHNEDGMKDFVTGKNPTAKAIYAECVENAQLYELSKVNL